MWDISNGDKISLGSAAIALCAFAATTWQAWVARHHNRLSVRPTLVWIESKRNVTAPNGTPSFGVVFSLKNHGLGPAIVRDRFFTVNDVRFKKPDGATDEVEAFVEHLLGKAYPYRLLQFGLPGKDVPIPAGSEVIIADVEFGGMRQSEVNAVIAAIGRIAFHVLYESMYEERFRFSSFDGNAKGWPHRVS